MAERSNPTEAMLRALAAGAKPVDWKAELSPEFLRELDNKEAYSRPGTINVGKPLYGTTKFATGAGQKSTCKAKGNRRITATQDRIDRTLERREAAAKALRQRETEAREIATVRATERPKVVAAETPEPKRVVNVGRMLTSHQTAHLRRGRR